MKQKLYRSSNNILIYEKLENKDLQNKRDKCLKLLIIIL